MNFSEALDYLDSVQREGEKLSLETIAAIVAHFPFSLASIRFVQIAGTNGKGSTTHFLAEILNRAGYRTGRFTSPHLSDVRERIAVDGRIISRPDFAAGTTFVRDHCQWMIDRGLIDQRPTFFETVFLVALFHFQRRKVEWVALEVGLGGRLDATSTITPAAAVITNISRDHTAILGTTLEAIAGEKAGIIKPGVPVICGCPPHSAAARVIRNRAGSMGAVCHPVVARPTDLVVVDTPRSYDCRYFDGLSWHRFRVRMHGRHQTGNAAIAVKTAMVLRSLGAKIPEAAIRAGIRSSIVPARIETFPGRPPLLIDGSHNPEGAKALAGYLRERGIGGATLLFGVLEDKEYLAMAAQLRPFAGRVILTRPRSHRALDPRALVPLFPGLPCRVIDAPAEALAFAKTESSLIIVCGSLYLAGEVRPLVLRRPRRGRKTIS
jgi:dihydrofolate synthase / folylpolyglutamate synthase